MILALREFSLRAFTFLRLAPHSEAVRSQAADLDPYRLSRGLLMLHRCVGSLPPVLRERLAEAWLRRRDAPGPAAEHVFQYLLSEETAMDRLEATVSKGADNFYRRQYRQYLNPTMGAFAATATMAALVAGGPPRGHAWFRRRPVAIAMTQSRAGAPPILVLDHQTIATPVFLPRPKDDRERSALARWLGGRGPALKSYRDSMAGDEMRSGNPGARARRCSAVGAMLDVTQAAIQSKKLAILALHPRDPDAMGLHITLFGVEAAEADLVERDYALGGGALDLWRRAAEQAKAELIFLLGGVEEAFTQCSQNLFIKRARDDAAAGRAVWPDAWSPSFSLDRLLASQFEIIQATVSASGLPGVSPRNGAIGMAGFAARRRGRTLVLIPYFAGNAVHGHAAKLWSNPYASLLIWDDHTTRCAVTISGPARVVSHGDVLDEFPDIVEILRGRRRRNGTPADDPEYWFEHEAADIRLQDEAVPANWLDPARSACSIHAAGLAQHGKKPAYFAAESLPPYDMAWQHEREAEGRPRDPSGVARRYWEWEAAPALEARRAHLAQLADNGP